MCSIGHLVTRTAFNTGASVGTAFAPAPLLPGSCQGAAREQTARRARLLEHDRRSTLLCLRCVRTIRTRSARHLERSHQDRAAYLQAFLKPRDQGARRSTEIALCPDCLKERCVALTLRLLEVLQQDGNEKRQNSTL